MSEMVSDRELLNELGVAVGRIESMCKTRLTRILDTLTVDCRALSMDHDDLRTILADLTLKVDSIQAHRLLKDFKRNRKKKRR